MNKLYWLLMVFISNAALSATSPIVGSNNAEPLSTANLTQWTIGLVFVLLMILVVAWLAKRFTGLTSNHKGDLKIVSGIALGSREKAILIKAGQQHILLGVAPGRVVNLHTFEKGEISEKTNRDVLTGQTFKENLQNIMKKGPD
jgi:flagellar protein FliO/FliZ